MNVIYFLKNLSDTEACISVSFGNAIVPMLPILYMFINRGIIDNAFYVYTIQPHIHEKTQFVVSPFEIVKDLNLFGFAKVSRHRF